MTDEDEEDLVMVTAGDVRFCSSGSAEIAGDSGWPSSSNAMVSRMPACTDCDVRGTSGSLRTLLRRLAVFQNFVKTRCGR